jgi:hypothetical protein
MGLLQITAILNGLFALLNWLILPRLDRSLRKPMPARPLLLIMAVLLGRVLRGPLSCRSADVWSHRFGFSWRFTRRTRPDDPPARTALPLSGDPQGEARLVNAMGGVSRALTTAAWCCSARRF